MVAQGALIGREPELAELQRTLESARLLTITGAGGCGKTRLALELADRVARSTPGVDCALAMLAGASSEEELVALLLARVGGRERFGSTPRQVLLAHLASRRTLLVLDNCEHLLTAVGRLASELLDAAQDVQILATSREPLTCSQECVFRLGALGLPDPGGGISALVRSDAARLFVERAAVRNPAFALTPTVASAVAEICCELDGLPLALVLAAGRIDALSVQQIARGLSRRGRLATAVGEDALSQHQSMRASLDWSYRLLEEHERALLRGLSVFSGGFTTSAARAVVAPDQDVGRVREILRALEERGLLARAPGARQERWTLLQTVAEYAGEQLSSVGESERIAGRHLAWFTAWAAQADRRLLQRDGPALIDEDDANLRRALERALRRDPTAALEIASSLMLHWILAEHFEQARSLCAAVLAAVGEDGDVGARAVVLCGAALVGMLGEDYEGAITSTRAGLELAGEVDEPGVRAACLRSSSMVLIQTGADLEEGLRNAELAVDLARRTGDPLAVAFALVTLAMAAALCERFDMAGQAYDEFLAIPGPCEHPRLRTWAEHAAAWTQVSVGSPARALAHVESALALEGNAPSMTYFQILSFRIQALARSGATAQAVSEGSDALRQALGSDALQAAPAIELALTVAEFLHGDLEAAQRRARALLALPQPHTLALARDTLARIALTRGELDEAHANARELETLAERSGSARQRALAAHLRGCAALGAGETDRGRDLLHSALGTYAELGLDRDASDTLDELALLAAGAGEVERGARLAGAAAATRARLGCAPVPGKPDRLQHARARIAAGTGPDCWEAAWTEGRALPLADAIAYARRRRGSRGRPPAGWASLTPTELDVAQLAASGMSNPEIAARLFIARGTVKMHLANTYRKLHLANRTELAAAMSAHASGNAPPPIARGHAAGERSSSSPR